MPKLRPPSAAGRAAEASAFSEGSSSATARARNRGFGLLSLLRAHTKLPYRTDLLGETLRALNRPGRARTGREEGHGRAAVHEDGGGELLRAGGHLGLYPIVTSQYSPTTLHRVSYHIQ